MCADSPEVHCGPDYKISLDVETEKTTCIYFRDFCLQAAVNLCLLSFLRAEVGHLQQ